MSSNNEYAIQVQDVSKIYKLYDKPIDRLKESLSLTHLARRALSHIVSFI
jgi:teichoic acid transport system ATP-binding protein